MIWIRKYHSQLRRLTKIDPMRNYISVSFWRFFLLQLRYLKLSQQQCEQTNERLHRHKNKIPTEVELVFSKEFYRINSNISLQHCDWRITSLHANGLTETVVMKLMNVLFLVWIDTKFSVNVCLQQYCMNNNLLTVINQGIGMCHQKRCMDKFVSFFYL